jgi:hypothetical protein
LLLLRLIGLVFGFKDGFFGLGLLGLGLRLGCGLDLRLGCRRDLRSKLGGGSIKGREEHAYGQFVRARCIKGKKRARHALGTLPLS